MDLVTSLGLLDYAEDRDIRLRYKKLIIPKIFPEKGKLPFDFSFKIDQGWRKNIFRYFLKFPGNIKLKEKKCFHMHFFIENFLEFP